MIKSIKDGNEYVNYCGAWKYKEIAPVEWFGEGAVLEFEGMKVTGPLEFDKWLRQVYGDYMELPPEDRRVPHHYADVIDAEKPYTDYMNN